LREVWVGPDHRYFRTRSIEDEPPRGRDLHRSLFRSGGEREMKCGAPAARSLSPIFAHRVLRQLNDRLPIPFPCRPAWLCKMDRKDARCFAGVCPARIPGPRRARYPANSPRCRSATRARPCRSHHRLDRVQDQVKYHLLQLGQSAFTTGKLSANSVCTETPFFMASLRVRSIVSATTIPSCAS